VQNQRPLSFVKVPATQSVHTLAAVSEYFPGWHALQFPLEYCPLKVPGAQFRQKDVLARAYWPGGHPRHALDAPVENVPFSH
jgi:hypothetical protein